MIKGGTRMRRGRSRRRRRGGSYMSVSIPSIFKIKPRRVIATSVNKRRRCHLYTRKKNRKPTTKQTRERKRRRWVGGLGQHGHHDLRYPKTQPHALCPIQISVSFGLLRRYLPIFRTWLHFQCSP